MFHLNRRPALSVIIPTYDEEMNVHELVERLHDSLTAARIRYELIFIDDHSVDGTFWAVELLADRYPIRAYLKNGPKGKAFSLIQGFGISKYDYVAMIDADLQYPPEAIPAMLQRILDDEAEIIIANRTQPQTSLLRRVASTSNRKIFGSFMWGIADDVQSGLKVFKKSLLEGMVLDPSPWTFDLEFLVKSRQIGARIAGHEIVFAARKAGEAKVNVLTSAPQIIMSSIRLKLKYSHAVNIWKNRLRLAGDHSE